MAKATVSLGGRDILDLDSLSVEEYELILKTAAEMKRIMKRDIKKGSFAAWQIYHQLVL